MNPQNQTLDEDGAHAWQSRQQEQLRAQVLELLTGGTSLDVVLAALANGAAVLQPNKAREQHQSLVRLQNSEARLRALVEHTSEAIVVHQATRIVYVNPAAVKLFGAATANDLLGTPTMTKIVGSASRTAVSAVLDGIIVLNSATDHNAQIATVEDVPVTDDIC